MSNRADLEKIYIVFRTPVLVAVPGGEIDRAGETSAVPTCSDTRVLNMSSGHGQDDTQCLVRLNYVGVTSKNR